MSRWKIGSALGIGIYMHWSFLLLPAFVAYMNYQQGGAPAALLSLALVAAVIVCVVLHELGHAAMARYYGIPTRDITLYPIGGVARLERMTEKPWHEFFIALAGPAVNVVICALLLVLFLIFALIFGFRAFMQDLAGEFLTLVFAANVLLVVFNLLPAFPMDGGRVFRALLALRLGRLRATEVAARVGLLFAGAMIVGGLFWSFHSEAPGTLPVVGLFIALMGQMELAAVRQRERIRQAEPIDVLPAEREEILDVQRAEGQPGFSGIAWDVGRRVWIVWQDGRPVASLGSSSE